MKVWPCGASWGSAAASPGKRVSSVSFVSLRQLRTCLSFWPPVSCISLLAWIRFLHICLSLSFYASLGLACYNLFSCFWLSLFLCLLVLCQSLFWLSLSICLCLSVYDHNGLFWLSVICLSFYGLFGLVWLSACFSVCRWQLDQRLPQVCRAVGHPEIVIPIILDWVFAISIKLGSGMPLIGQSKPNDRNDARPKNLGGKKSVIGVAQLVPVTRS